MSSVPAPALPATSREVRLARSPRGLPRPEDFEVATRPMVAPAAGEVVVRNHYFVISPALRSLFATPAFRTPLDPLRSGQPLVGTAVGEVVAAGDATTPAPGTLVSHHLGWREYAVLPAGFCTPLDPALPDEAAHLSQGALAHAALTGVAGLRPGETVFVAGGAGAVGSMTGQLARLLGAGRVIGSTGSTDKARVMTERLGYDEAVLREGPGGPDGDFGKRLREAAPDGIDVVVDLVGGAQLRAATETANPGARIALVGALAGQLDAQGDGASAPVTLDTFRLVVQRVSLRGVSGLDHPESYTAWPALFAAGLAEGRLTFPHERITGMEAAPRALQEAMAGRYVGAVVVDLRGASAPK
ncbi:MDR family NADP-dependent oxidoreductase [Streptomyces sp. NPDC007088]|uniref:MDR family NADP-dependent oxidoreductase n=1 Tax=Streptomyces sp. NPDC007088 TaxID=3364773 RepID=UPI0036C26E14